MKTYKKQGKENIQKKLKCQKKKKKKPAKQQEKK